MIEYQVINSLIFQPKHMLWVLKRTVRMRRYFHASNYNSEKKNTKITLLIVLTSRVGLIHFSEHVKLVELETLQVMPRSHIHGLDAGLATDVHSWQSVLVRSFL